MVQVSVVIPHYNDLDNLGLCLADLASQTLPAAQIEVIVADNNSACGFEAVRKVAGEHIRVVPARVQGAGPARNIGVAAAVADTLAFVDSDCRPHPDWLRHGIAALATGDIVGGAVDVTVCDPGRPTSVEAFERVFAFRNRHYIRRKGFSVTCNMFVRRSVFDEVGGFRAGVSEDLDWGRRAGRLGYRIMYEERARVAHPARHDWAALVHKWRRISRQSFLLSRERPAGVAIWLLRHWLVLFSVPAHLPVVLLRGRRLGLRAQLGAVGILTRLRVYRFVEAHRLAGRWAWAGRPRYDHDSTLP